jgi:hypothetical protein
MPPLFLLHRYMWRMALEDPVVLDFGVPDGSEW